jgi:hypothetical protein
MPVSVAPGTESIAFPRLVAAVPGTTEVMVVLVSVTAWVAIAGIGSVAEYPALI